MEFLACKCLVSVTHDDYSDPEEHASTYVGTNVRAARGKSWPCHSLTAMAPWPALSEGTGPAGLREAGRAGTGSWEPALSLLPLSTWPLERP